MLSRRNLSVEKLRSSHVFIDIYYLNLVYQKLLFPRGILEAETFSSASLPLDWKALDILLNINKLILLLSFASDDISFAYY